MLTFAELEQDIPYGQYGKKHSRQVEVYEDDAGAVAYMQPGKYQDKSNGGDFVVLYTGMVQGKRVEERQVTYPELLYTWQSMPAEVRSMHIEAWQQGLALDSFGVLVAMLVVAESRRYSMYERAAALETAYAWQHRGRAWTDGRWLPLQLLLVVHDWPELAAEAAKLWRLGRHAVPKLAKMAAELAD